MKQTPLKRKTPLRPKKRLEPKRTKAASFGGGPYIPLRTLRKKRPKATPEEQAHMNAVAKLGCIVSRNLGEDPKGQVLLHHIRTGYGYGVRASHWETIPLVNYRHQNGGLGVAFHDGPRTFQAKFGTEIALLKQVYDLLEIPFERLPELRGSEPPWWESYLDGTALTTKASQLFPDMEEA